MKLSRYERKAITALERGQNITSGQRAILKRIAARLERQQAHKSGVAPSGSGLGFNGCVGNVKH